mmetsp:Transcript_11058/g.19924  ORF Transcript_11058/g.19924 Transcript_11058/m.19924 type:complete len:98 (+) Transcript_11058:2-295(+)
MLAASLFPAIIGSQFEGAIYVKQNLKFLSPMLVGNPLRAEVEVKQISNVRRRVRVEFYTRLLSPCTSHESNSTQETTTYVSGEATAVIPLRYILLKW